MLALEFDMLGLERGCVELPLCADLEESSDPEAMACHRRLAGEHASVWVCSICLQRQRGLGHTGILTYWWITCDCVLADLCEALVHLSWLILSKS